MAEPTVSSHWQPGTHRWARWPRVQHVREGEREGGREEVRGKSTERRERRKRRERVKEVD